MKNNAYVSPEIEVSSIHEIDILTASNEFVFLPTDEFGEI